MNQFNSLLPARFTLIVALLTLTGCDSSHEPESPGQAATNTSASDRPAGYNDANTPAFCAGYYAGSVLSGESRAIGR